MKIQPVFQILQKIEESALILLMIVMTCVVFTGVATRYVFGFSFYWIEEVPRYALVWVTFLGAAALTRVKIMHPRVLGLINSLPDRSRRTALIAGNVVMMAMTLIMGSGALIMMSVVSDQLSPALEVPMYIVYSVIPLSALIMTGRIITITYKIIQNDFEGRV